MINPRDVLEVAVLILAAFVIGAVLGLTLRLSFRPRARKPETAIRPAPLPGAPSRAETRAKVSTRRGVLAAANDPVPEPPSLVVVSSEPAPAPVIAAPSEPIASEPAATEQASAVPVAAEPAPTTAAAEPVANTPETAVPPVAPELAISPARRPGETMSGRRVPFARAEPDSEAVAEVPVTGSTDNVIPFPRVAASEPVAPADPVDLVDQSPTAVREEKNAEPVVSAAAVVASDPLGDVRAALESLDDADQPVSAPQPAPAETAASPAPVAQLDDESAAMRAIEGNWSPASEAVAVPAMAQPVIEAAPVPAALPSEPASAAPLAAELPTEAGAEVRPGYAPPLLAEPNNGRADPLIYVVGILPDLEKKLNALGIFHFEQIAALTNDNVSWVESQLGISGRIAPELWREQARELAAMTRSRRA